ncbi:MAG: thioredoxin family protein [Acidimicrobiia bacterium]
MSDAGVRVAVVVTLTVVALLVAWLARLLHSRRQTRLDVSGLISGPGVVVFTKDDCPNCAAVLELLDGDPVTVRQVRAEAEPEVFEKLAIEGVPITVVVASAGRRVAQFAGLPRAASLRRALRRVG